MNKLFTLSFVALIGATSHSAIASETPDSPCPMHQAKHTPAASMPHDMKPMHHGAHDMCGKACLASCKAAPANEASVPLNDVKHTH